MLSWRSILFGLVLLPRLLAYGADRGDALEHYNARLDEIARTYKQRFSEIRKNRRRIVSEKADFRAAEQEIRELAMMRNAAIAEAKLAYQKEVKEQKQTGPTPSPQLSREERQRELMTARRKLFEDGQKAFWERVAQAEPKVAQHMDARRQAVEKQQTAFWAELPLREARVAELMTARRQAVHEEQTAFWAELFDEPKTSSPNQLLTAASYTRARNVEKQGNPLPQQKNTAVQVQYGPALAAAR